MYRLGDSYSPCILWLTHGPFTCHQAGAALCRRMFASRDAAVMAAKQLVRIAHHFRFDGWLVNIENELDVEQVRHLPDAQIRPI